MGIIERTNLLKKCRQTMLRAIGGLESANPMKKKLRQALRDPHFPLSYLLRNIVLLDREASWQRLTPGEKRRVLRRLLHERASFFLLVRDWLRQNGGYASILIFSPPPPDGEAGRYCIHCGGCCETPGGYPDFPPESIIPQEWKAVFSQGLGKGHRFCPFLWELGSAGMSLCAVHPWRANPCRTFGEDDCRFVLQDSDLPYVTDPERTRASCAVLRRAILFRQ